MKQIKQNFFGRLESDFKDKMKNRLSFKLCQKNLLTEKKCDELGKYSSISYVRESHDTSSLTCAWKIILRKIIPRNDDLLKVILTKIKYSKTLQNQRTKSEIKTSFNFAKIICKYVSKNWIESSIHLSLLQWGTGE